MRRKSWYEIESEKRDDQEARMGVYLILFLVVIWMFGLVRDAFGADPQFTVTNHCPPTFTVVNKVPGGGTKPLPDPRSPASIDPGAKNTPSYTYKTEYHPQLGGWVTVRYEDTTVPGVTAPTFRRGIYNPTHNCPSCGRSQYVVSGPGPVPGSHTHACPCGASWYH